MKSTLLFPIRLVRRALLGHLLALPACLIATTYTYTWIGSPTAPGWGETNCWSASPAGGPGAPVGSDGIIIFGATAYPTNYLGVASRTCASITFQNTAPSYYIELQNSNATIAKNLTVPTITINPGDSHGHTLGSTTNGNVVLDSDLTVEHDGTHVFTIGRPITGAYGLIKTGTGPLALTAANTYTGDTTIRGGTLTLIGSGSIAASTDVSVASGATFQTASSGYTVHEYFSLSGGGTVTGAVTVASGGIVSPGDAEIGTLTLSALTLSSGSTVNFVFADATNGLVNVTDHNGLSAKGTVDVNVSGPNIGLGQFPLFKYSGALGGAGFGAFTLSSVPAGVTAKLVNDTASFSVDLEITAIAPSLVWQWTNGASGIWDIGATVDWMDVYTGLPATYTNGDVVLFDDTATTDILEGENQMVTLATTVTPVGITVNNSALTYTFGGTGQIAGPTSFLMEGDGLVVMGCTNDYTGNTIIDDGTFMLGANNVIPTGSGAGNVILNGLLDLAGFSTTINGLSGTGTIDDSTGNGSLTVGNNHASSTFAGVIQDSAGILTLTKIGTGTLTLSGLNTYSGPTVVQDGTLGVTTAGQPDGLISVSNAATLHVLVSTVNSTLETTGLWLGTGGKDYTTNSFELGSFGNPTAPVIYATSLTVNGTNIISLTGVGLSVGIIPLIQYQGVIGGNGYSFNLGSVPTGLGAYLSNAPTSVMLVITNVPLVTPLVWTGNVNTNWDVGSTSNWSFKGVACSYTNGMAVQFVDGAANQTQVYLTTNVFPGGITVDNSATNYTFSGPGQISGDGGLTKTGTGILTLNETNNLGGSTAVNEGTLMLTSDSSLAGSPSILVASGAVLDVSALPGGLTIASGQVLSGYGTVNGAVTVAPGGAVMPGAGSGTLNVQGGVDLLGTANLQAWKNSGVLTNTTLAASGSLTFGGASILKLVQYGDTLTGGEVFNLFAASSFSGAFYAWTLPALNPGLNWCFNQLAVDGSLSVNRAPVAANYGLQTTVGIPLYLSVAQMLAGCTDPDGDKVSLTAIGTPAFGSASLNADGSTINYIPSASSSNYWDVFTYTIGDGRGGSSTGSNMVFVAANEASSTYNVFAPPLQVGGAPNVRFTGFPGYAYIIQRSTNLIYWVDIATNILPANGLLSFQDTTLPQPSPNSVFYRAIFELGTAEAQAAPIFEATGVQGGFVADVQCGGGQLTAALRQNANYLVQGLDTDAGNVAAARQYISSLGMYGPVSADQWDGSHLPYIDGFVNLLVVEKLGALTTNEIMRVLAPLGVAYVNQGGGWTTTVKPRPANIDDWTHYLHDAAGTCVSQDTVVGKPQRLQWVAGPRFNRHHDVLSSFNACVSANGRLFEINDSGSIQSILLPSDYTLTAYDGFNGTMLWQRSIASWHPHMYGYKSGPWQLQRRLVAVGNVVYVTLDYYGPLVALDAATGATLQTYPQTTSAQEVICSGGILYVLVDPNPYQWAQWQSYYDTSTCLTTASTWWKDHPRVLTAINATSGVVLWAITNTVFPGSFSADATGLVYLDGTYMHKVDLLTGSNLWTSSQSLKVRDPMYTAFGASTIIYSNTVLIAPYGTNTGGTMTGDGTVYSMDYGSGLMLAKWPLAKNSYAHDSYDLFALNGLVWSTASATTNPICYGYNPRTGALVTTIDPGLDVTWIHERCYRDKATVNYFLTSRSGLEFVDTQGTNSGVAHNWMRGACLYGVMPANGFLYEPPNDCACQIENKLSGLCALTATASVAETNDPDSERLQPGPAYTNEVVANPAPDDWPVYRHDALRSSYTPNSVPASVSTYWQTTVGGKLSGVTLAEGRVLVASVDTHTIYALDPETGTNIWSYTVGGRVDSPPTTYQGRVFFGSADGYVYCLRATDGALIWRFLAAPTDLRLTSYGQLESVWPVSGSVLVVSNEVYCVSGRHMYLDGGCHFLALNPTNGVKLVERVMNNLIPGTTNLLTTLEESFNGPVAIPDLLSSDGGTNLYMKTQRFDLNGVRYDLAPRAATYTNEIGDYVHLFAPIGLLDTTAFHRSYWVYGKAMSCGAGGYYLAGKVAPCGDILSFDGSNVYGYGRQPEYYEWTRPKNNMLFSAPQANTFNTSHPYNWTNLPPLFVKAMVATTDNLFLAGPPDVEDEVQTFATLDAPQTQTVLTNQAAALQGAQGGQFRVVSKSTGATLASYDVNFLPVWDGMAAARASIYVATQDGRVVCLR